MSTKLQQLRERRNAKAIEANALNSKYSAEQRMPKEEIEKLDSVLAEVEAIDGEIAQHARLVALAGENVSAEDLRNRHTIDPSKQDDKDRAAALRAYMSGGVAALSDGQRAAMFARQNGDIRAAMSTTTNSEGGFTTAPEFFTSLETAMKSYGAIFDAVTTLRTATGTTMNFPTSDPTAETGEIVGQNTTATALDTAFGNATLDVYKYSSKSIALPWELTQDSFLDIEGYINDVLAMRLGRILSAHLTNGTGTGQPRGLVTASTAGKVGATGTTVSFGYDDLIDLEHSLDPAYRNQAGVGYMFHDSTLKVARKIKDSQGRPIFVPGYETGVPGGAPDTLLGRPVIVNQDMPVMAANAKSILFGAFKKYVNRRVMDLTLFRMTDSAYTLKGQVGFVAFNRQGGNLIDVGGAVKYFQNSST